MKNSTIYLRAMKLIHSGDPWDTCCPAIWCQEHSVSASNEFTNIFGGDGRRTFDEWWDRGDRESRLIALGLTYAMALDEERK